MKSILDGGFDIDIPEDDIRYLFNVCLSSPYVNDNDVYRSQLAKTEITIIMWNMINAFAYKRRDEDAYGIVILSGLMYTYRYISVAANELIEYGDTTKYREMMEDYSKWIGGGKPFDSNAVASLLTKHTVRSTDEYSVMKINSYAHSMLLNVIAHEVGHICLGHCDDMSRGNSHAQVNNERSADLFASSLISSTMFSERALVAALFVTVSFEWLHHAFADTKEQPSWQRTHPDPIERALNLIRSAPEVFRGVGIDKDVLYKLLPQGKEA